MEMGGGEEDGRDGEKRWDGGRYRSGAEGEDEMGVKGGEEVRRWRGTER